jgi:hypothetical protein
MPPTGYVLPYSSTAAFNCPHCQVYSRYFRSGLYLTRKAHDHGSLKVVICENCLETTVWYDNKLIFPVEPETSKSEDI